jgi:NADPH:quinone reductase-like Zn-dependent oxidoreductase
VPGTDLAGVIVAAGLDTVGGDEAVSAFGVIKADGHFLSIARANITSEQCATAHVECLGSPGGAATAPVTVLEQLGQLAQQGRVHIHVDRTYPLARAAEALQYLHEGHVEGTVVLTVAQ